MRKTILNISAILAISGLLGLILNACQPDATDPPEDDYYETEISSNGDETWDPGNEYDVVYQVVFVGQSPSTEVLAPATVSGLPNGVIATINYYEVGVPTDGSVPPLTNPVLPYQAKVNYNVQSGVVPGTYTITVAMDPDNNQVAPASTTFGLTTTDPGSTTCNTLLIGNYAGPASCTPPGFGDIGSDFSVNADDNKIDIYVALYDQGSNLVADLNCGTSSFTIPQQTVMAGGGTQQLNVDGSGTWTVAPGDTTLILILNSQLVGSSDPPNTCQIDLTKQ